MRTVREVVSDVEAYEEAKARIDQYLVAFGQGCPGLRVSRAAAGVIRSRFTPALQRLLTTKPDTVEPRMSYVLDLLRTVGVLAARLATDKGSCVIHPEHVYTAIETVRAEQREHYGGQTDFCWQQPPDVSETQKSPSRVDACALHDNRYRWVCGCPPVLLPEALTIHDVKETQGVGRVPSWTLGSLTFLLAAGLLCGAATIQAQDEPPAAVEVSAGAVASLSSDESAVLPTATVLVDAPVYLGQGSAIGRVFVRGTLSGLPGETVDLGNVSTFKAFEVVGEYERRIGVSYDGGSSTYVVARGQFATKLASDPAPRVRYPRAYGVGVAFERRDAVGIARRAEIIVGRSQIASPDSWGKGQVIVDLSVRLAKFKVGGVQSTVNLRVESHLNIARALPRGTRDVTRAYVEAAAGWS